LKGIRRCAAWLALVALLIDGLLPTAVSAAMRPGTATPLPLCRAASGAPQPAQQAPSLPMRHCAMCAACPACLLGPLPSRGGEGLITRFLASAAHPAIIAFVAGQLQGADYAAAQPRAPPQAA